MRPDQPIREQALAWAMLTREPDFADWDGFTAWLEADAEHADAYDAVQFALDEADAALDIMPETEFTLAANDNPPKGWMTTRRAWLGGAIAASLVLALSFIFGFGPQGETLYATAPGETRLIALDDGSTVELGGGSRLAVLDDRAARLEGGQALFTIRHDAADPFVLTAGADRLVDAGTVFDVRLAGKALDLAVAEGAVIVNPEAQALRVDAGERAVRTGERYWVGPIDPQAVGEWTRGRISFEAASLAEIAAELTRATGIVFTAAPSDIRLAGSIALDQVRADPRALEALLGVRVTPRGKGWVIAAE
ncbi:FecR domain-containing protein [Porphyrobacter sp. SLTP]|uniref:FecR family protein n=1 Tax=Porphyrobacter sp. SLTP TaxID=2683266 RepID=UPI00256FAA66|nr:FecR domain-containing protein [Porphyrobacter sp. SLTP]